MQYPLRNLLRCAALLLAFACSGPTAGWAGLIAFDTFDYAPGSDINTANGGSNGTGGQMWTGAWTGASGATVETKSLSYASGSVVVNGGNTALQYTGGVNDQFAFRPFTSQNLAANGPVYFSFLLNTPTNGSGNTAFFEVFPGRTGVAPSTADDTGLILRGATGSTSRFGIRSGKSSNQTFGGPANIANDETHFVVVKFDWTDTANRATMFIDPDSNIELDQLSTSDTGGATFQTALDSLNLRLAVASGTYFIDEIRVGTTFESVVTVPEPRSVTLAVLAAIALPMLLLRARAGGPTRVS